MIRGYKGKGRLLKPESYQTIFESQLVSSAFEKSDVSALNDDYDVGIFWAISKPGYRLHKGGMIGVYSIIYFNAESGFGALAFCNNANPAFGDVVKAITVFEKSIE